MSCVGLHIHISVFSYSDECIQSECQYLFMMNGDVQLETSNTLQDLIEYNRYIYIQCMDTNSRNLTRIEIDSNYIINLHVWFLFTIQSRQSQLCHVFLAMGTGSTCIFNIQFCYNIYFVLQISYCSYATSTSTDVVQLLGGPKF